MAAANDDWYGATIRSLAVVFISSLAAFAASFAALFLWVRTRFSARQAHELETIDTPELVLIKSHTRLTRALALVGIALQAWLATRVVALTDATRTAGYTLSLFRAVGNLCAYFLGFTTNTHAFFRLAFLVLLVEIVIMDTVAVVSLGMVANCLRSTGLLCGGASSALSLEQLDALRVRDLAALFLNPWLALQVGLLSASIGFCGSRFSSRRLSLSRPRMNVRAALAFYFPDRFGPHAQSFRSKRSTNKRWHP
ncbi:hypothetical protein P43SY_007566 [Pythium insidiosum]|uniref:Uncharacterized protein n=1 Tax=Pythium insidiosum TaxID=114742 RepID=A0AAD5Q9Z5_PYTIN|nr:hypothetical protein P43SY_007566 [Pythium insidiosum]